jgi:LysM repeat protein
MTKPETGVLPRWIYGLILLSFSILPLKGAAAAPPLDEHEPVKALSPGELIAAVNQLRVSRGLNPLTVHPILMETAQRQANALAASGGAVGHTRPNGMSFTEQLLMLGYPLAGDLSLGGYRAENITWAHPDMSAEEVITLWLGDALHTNTMLSPYYEDIGAGVAVNADGDIYYVIDCAMPTPSRTPQAYTPVSGPGGSLQGTEELRYIQPVILSTARPDGDVIHEVLYGQALWSIAIAYGVKINQIQRYNNLTDNTIYVGQKLLVLKGATQPAPEALATGTPTPPDRAGSPRRPTPRQTVFQPAEPSEELTPQGTAQQTASSTPAVLSQSNGRALSPTTMFLAGFFLVSMFVGGLITWLDNRLRSR